MKGPEDEGVAEEERDAPLRGDGPCLYRNTDSYPLLPTLTRTTIRRQVGLLSGSFLPEVATKYKIYRGPDTRGSEGPEKEEGPPPHTTTVGRSSPSSGDDTRRNGRTGVSSGVYSSRRTSYPSGASVVTPHASLDSLREV